MVRFLEENLRRLAFMLVSALFVFIAVWALNLFSVRSFSPSVILLPFSAVIFGFLLLEFGREQGLKNEELYGTLAAVILLPLLLSAFALSAHAVLLSSVAMLFFLFLLIPPLSFYIREILVKK